MNRYHIARLLWGVVFVVALLDLTIYLFNNWRESIEDISELCNTNRLINRTLHGLQSKSPQTSQETSQSERKTLARPAMDDAEFCQPGSPCVYPDDVDFRIIVMTYKRSSSLTKLLKSLEDLELDGASASLEIFIDRNSKGEVNKPTLEVAQSFSWGLGRKRVHVWSRNVGIYGQWIETWRPKPHSKEIALILEDDISVSKHCFHWLKAAHQFFGRHSDISGYTLQSDNIRTAVGGKALSANSSEVAFLYRVLGSWGFSPHPDRWREFQDWYYMARNNSSFHPYVKNIVMTSWYKAMEKKKKEHTMWTMWHIYFTDKNRLFCLHANLKAYVGNGKYAIGVNRQEPGLHYNGKGLDNTGSLITDWTEDFVKFSNKTVKFDYDGKIIT